jgi:hypothetical protein
MTLSGGCSMPDPFDHHELRGWFHEAEALPALGKVDVLQGHAPFPAAVGSSGDGPFTESEFDDFLREYGIEPHHPGEELENAVLGRTGWSNSDLEELVEARSGSTLKVYSQEMFLAYIATGIDPYSRKEKLVKAFGDGHPALQFLAGIGFDWPTTHVVLGPGVGFDVERPTVGFLRAMGYTVGRNGRSRSERRRVLRRIYGAPVPANFDANYRAEWGQPSTCARLKKMANTIATLCRSPRRCHTPPVVLNEARRVAGRAPAL